jgi:hypothetical protein
MEYVSIGILKFCTSSECKRAAPPGNIVNFFFTTSRKIHCDAAFLVLIILIWGKNGLSMKLTIHIHIMAGDDIKLWTFVLIFLRNFKSWV